MAVPRWLRDLVLRRDGHMCVIAGPSCTGRATVADHRANRGAGGSRLLDDPRNLIASCGLENQLKEDAHGEDLERLIERGIRVRKAATNAATLGRCAISPVMYPDGSWWLLDNSGGREEVRGNALV